jgi:sensor histidine kinase YesM
MKKLIIILLAVYVLGIGNFPLRKLISHKEIEQWNAYKEVAFGLDKKDDYPIKKSIPNNGNITVGILGTRTDEDRTSITNWLFVGYSGNSFTLKGTPYNCDLIFSFSNDTIDFNKEKVATCIALLPYIDVHGNLSHVTGRGSGSSRKKNPTKIEISSKFTDQNLRNFIIKQSFINYLGIYENSIEISNYLKFLNTKVEVDSFPFVRLSDRQEFFTITKVYRSNYTSYFDWQPLLNQIKKETGVNIEESEIKQTSKIDYAKKYPDLKLFTQNKELTSLDRYIINNFKKAEHEDWRNPYEEIKVLDSKFDTFLHYLLLLIIILAYSANYFDKAALTIYPFTKQTIIYKNIRDSIPVLIYSILPSLEYTLSKGFTSYFPILGTLDSLLRNVILIMVPLNLVYLVEKFLFTEPHQFLKQQIFAFATLLLGISIISYCNLNLIFSIYRYEGYTVHHINWSLIVIILIIGITRYLYNNYNFQKKLQIEARNQELTQLRELKTRAELNALQSRINPHFLYNSLNSIAGLAHEDAGKVEQMALSLSKLFRYSVNKEDSDFSSIKNEVEMALLYLEIEKVRFGNRLEYSVSVPKELEELMIPKFLIQPLVENAIKHGISKNPGNGLIKLSITSSEKEINIAIFDNGPKFPEDFITGYGLKSIHERLDILYPNKYAIQVQNEPEKNISITLNKA